MGRRPNRARDAAVAAAYLRGESTVAIAARQEPPVTSGAIVAVLRRLGIALRPPGKRGDGRAPICVVGPDGTVYGATLAEAARRLGVTYQALRGWGEVRDGVLYLDRVSARREREREAEAAGSRGI